MNFKFLFPTFLNRYRFVQKRLRQLATGHGFGQGLNLGTGEGDYDRMIASFCGHLTACDINADDIAHARLMNRGVLNVHYETNDALNLSYPDASFDLLVSCEVIEHVGQPEKMIREIARVLRPGGFAIMTFPSHEFPFTYDPVNRFWHWVRQPDDREYLIAQGAYAFGHEYLIGADDFKQWVQHAGLELVEFRPLSGYLIGLLEMYWTGVAQRIFKKNAQNVTADTSGALKVRPVSAKVPALVFITDALLALDRLLFTWGKYSVGKGVVLRKP
ncbi:MAG: class I SAM-dependent methyltransferase [Thermoanaerobaculia bacterium]|nr:class I SAM-dependent methyltransferase [Thermoanaerobaculia bacterium]